VSNSSRFTPALLRTHSSVFFAVTARASYNSRRELGSIIEPLPSQTCAQPLRGRSPAAEHRSTSARPPTTKKWKTGKNWRKKPESKKRICSDVSVAMRGISGVWEDIVRIIRGYFFPHSDVCSSYNKRTTGGSVAEWSACWTQAQKGPGSNRNRDAVG